MEEEWRFCTYHQIRHPASHFDKGDKLFVCKKARKEITQKTKEKNLARNIDPTYEKVCRKCKRKLNAEKNFGIDNSRPDGYFIWCNKCKTSKTISLKGVALEFRKKLFGIIFRKVKDSNRSIVRQLVEDFRHEGEQISFTGREWQIDILNDLTPNLVIRKPSQKGLTWVLERFVFALLMRYSDKPYKSKDHTGKERSRFIEAIYSFETQDKASKWSKVRLEKIKNDNAFIRDALTIGKTDSTLLMKLGRTSLHLVGRATISGVLTISADIVIVDEKDRDMNPAISNQIGSRTLESPFMNTPSTKGLKRTTSTPEVSGAGISLLYDNSDQREWEIFCVKCNTWQVLTYPECIGNFYEKGEEPKRDENGNKLNPYWRCMNCLEPIDWQTIGKWSPDDPDYYENCRWVVRKPINYNEQTGEGCKGRQVPFAGPDRTAPYFMAERDDPEHTIQYLYNHLLGVPFDDVSKTLVLDNFKRAPEFKWGYSGPGKYVLGCDHHPALGGFIVIWKQIPKSIIPSKPEGQWVCVYMEHVKKNEDLWDELISEANIRKGRVHGLIMEFGIDIAVLDREPDTNEVEKLIKEFSFNETVWSDKSGKYQESFVMKEEETDGRKTIPVCQIFEDKVSAIDWYFNKIRFGDVRFLESQAMSEKLLTEFISSHTNLYKGEVGTKSRSEEFNKYAAENIGEVYKKRVSSIIDHWVMASKFCAQATRIAIMAKRSRKSVFAPTIKGMDRIPGT